MGRGSSKSYFWGCNGVRNINEILGGKISAFSPEELETKKALSEARAITYLVEKFPDADSKIFYTDYTGEIHKRLPNAPAVCLAMENEKICKNCDGSKCSLKSRPVIKISKNPRGFEFLDVRWSCEHTCKFRPFKNSMLMKSRLNKNQFAQTLANFDTRNIKILETALNLAIKASQQHTNLIISGTIGAGKTHLATGILLENLRRNLQGFFWQCGELFDELKRTNFEGGHSEFTDKLKNVPCLVIDDIFRRVPVEPYGSQMFQIIEYRCENGLQTVITSNALTVKEFMDVLNTLWTAPMLSRMLENGAWTVIKDVEDYRLRHLRGM